MSTEIDWSKAPEGSEAARICRGDQVEFYRNAHGRFEFYSFNFGAWIASSTQKDDSRLIWRTGYAWSGEGIPPVGTVCECQMRGYGEWHRATILAHHNGHAWATGDDGKHCFTVPPHGNFRPIKTPEQIAAEEREKAVHQMGLDAGFGGSVQQCYERLYDAGYRKVTK